MREWWLAGLALTACGGQVDGGVGQGGTGDGAQGGTPTQNTPSDVPTVSDSPPSDGTTSSPDPTAPPTGTTAPPPLVEPAQLGTCDNPVLLEGATTWDATITASLPERKMSNGTAGPMLVAHWTPSPADEPVRWVRVTTADFSGAVFSLPACDGPSEAFSTFAPMDCGSNASCGSGWGSDMPFDTPVYIAVVANHGTTSGSASVTFRPW